VTLSKSDVTDLLDAIRAGGDLDVIRKGVELVFQALIEAEASEVVGAEGYERCAPEPLARLSLRLSAALAPQPQAGPASPSPNSATTATTTPGRSTGPTATAAGTATTTSTPEPPTSSSTKSRKTPPASSGADPYHHRAGDHFSTTPRDVILSPVGSSAHNAAAQDRQICRAAVGLARITPSVGRNSGRAPARAPDASPPRSPRHGNGGLGGRHRLTRRWRGNG
jgi:hypothetical protein